MIPVLYSFRRCPYAIRARIAIKVSGQVVELREISLRNKAPEFMQASPKGTVPVLQDGDDIISESFDIMLWALRRNDPEDWLTGVNMELILECDGPFKQALDRYKYATRFGDSDPLEQRGIAAGYLRKLESILSENAYLSGHSRGLNDMAIIGFVRQFAAADRVWFNAEPWPNLRIWLDKYISGQEFSDIMGKYPYWSRNEPVHLFPEKS